MTRMDRIAAQAEAVRRWRHIPTGRPLAIIGEAYENPVGTFHVGVSSGFWNGTQFHWMGEGNSWESAFADADRREAGQEEGR